MAALASPITLKSPSQGYQEGNQRKEVRVTTGPSLYKDPAFPPSLFTPVQANPSSLHPRSQEETWTGRQCPVAVGGRKGGASWSGDRSRDGGRSWGQNSRPREEARRGAKPLKENEPIQSREARGKNLVWCLTRGEEGGQGWALLIRFPS